MAVNERGRNAQGAAHAANLVLEEHPKGLHHLQVHLFRQAAHIVVALDLGGYSFDAGALDHIRINGSLGQPAGALDALGILVEGFHKEPADGLALGLGLREPFQRGEEIGRCVGPYHVEAHALVGGQNVGEFVFPEEAVVHENAGELRADGFIQQHGGHGGIHPAAKTQDHFFPANPAPEILNGGFNERIRGPVSLAAADIQRKVGKHLRALRGVIHLRMELHGIGGLSFELISGIFNIGRRGDYLGAFRQGRYGIPVGHPHLRFLLDSLQEGGFGYYAQHGAAIFPGVRGLHFSTTLICQILGSVADAQQREHPAELRQVHLRGVGIPHAAGTAAQDDALYAFVQGGHFIIRVDFAVNIQLPQAPPDELRYLGSEVQNEDFIHGR